MKIGILTFYFGTNYGGILQCYALQQVLKSKGHEVEIINYRGTRKISLLQRIWNKLRTIANIHSVFRLVKETFLRIVTRISDSSASLEDKAKCMHVFDEFRSHYLNLSPVVDETSISSFSDRYDAVVVGSDQVWTSLYDKEPIYFFCWLNENYRGKRIAYAACSAHSFVTAKRAKELATYMNRFDVISVRDLTTKKLVKQITGKDVPIVADPTVLYDFRDFVKESSREPYILCYILGNEIKEGHSVALAKIKAQYGAMKVKAVILPGSPNDIVHYADEILCGITPMEWVNLVAHASFVYTDSFHGVMFSLKYNCPFFAYYTDLVRASRLIDLKERFPQLEISEECPLCFEAKNYTALISKFDTSFKGLI